LRRLYFFCTALLFVGPVSGESQISIPADAEHGAWDPHTRTYTLTRDVVAEILVAEDSLTLDGGGHRVRAPDKGNKPGIVLDGRTGVTIRNVVIGDFARQILLLKAHGNTITRNTIGGAGFDHTHGRGIYLQESHDNTISYNVLERHNRALSIETSRDNIFDNNHIAQDRAAAVHIFGQSSGNKFVRNVFADNRKSVDISEYSQGNIFSLPKPIGGNYWDHTTEPDDNGDSFVDTTYTFSGGEDALPWIKANDWPRETAVATGLAGQVKAAPGTEVVLFAIGLTGNGFERLHSVTLRLEDLSTPTGLSWEDLQELRLYRSRDASMRSIEYRLGTLDQGAIQIGGLSTIAVTRIERPPSGVEIFYLATAVLNTKVTDGHAFRVGFGHGGVKMDGIDLGTAVRAYDFNRVVIDVEATRLAFAVQPGAAASGKLLGRQPVVVAQDEHDNIDRDFAETVTLALAGVGSLAMRAKAQQGMAHFSRVIYRARADGESLRLVVDDEDDVGLDLPPVRSDPLEVKR